MKKAFICAAAVYALAVGSAAAADMPVKAPVAILYNWTGWYLGVNAGYSWGRVKQQINTPGVAGYDDTTNIRGGEASVEGGYCWQRDGVAAAPIVGCFEVRYDFPAERGDSSTPNEPFVPTRITNKLDPFLIGPKLGFLTDANRTLWYAAGGLVVGQGANQASVIGDTSTGSASKWRTGSFVGAGVERMIDQHWSWKLEYDFEYFGSGSGFSNTLSPCTQPIIRAGCPAGLVPVVTVGNAYDHVITVGINYHFGSH
jgi:outer membrane immunogenic protein